MDLAKVPRYTVAQIAGKLKKTTNAVRHAAKRHDIGTLSNPRLRLFSDADVIKLKAVLHDGRGRPRRAD
jgi:hypothetical protein